MAKNSTASTTTSSKSRKSAASSKKKATIGTSVGASMLQEARASVQAVVADPSMKTALFALLLVFSLFLFTAQVSFLINWPRDFSLASTPKSALSAPEDVGNAMGKLGHALANRTVFHGFGVGAFFLPAWLFLFSVRKTFEIKRIKPVSLLLHFSFLTAFLSIALGWAVPEHPTLASGLSGYFGYYYLALKLGHWGVFMVLFGVLGAYIIITRRISTLAVQWKLKRQSVATKEGEAQDETVENTPPQMPSDNNEREASELEEPFDSSTPVQGADTESHAEEAEWMVVAKGEQEIEEVQEWELTHQADPVAPESDEEPHFEVEVVEEQEESDREINRKIKEFGEYDPTLDLSKFKLPTIDLLPQLGNSQINIDKLEVEANKDKIVGTLRNYGIEIQEIKATIGPTVTLYEIVPAAGIRISKIKNLEDDIALSLSALGIRIIAPIPGKGTIGIEVPNANPQMVSMRQVIASKKFQEADMELPVALGRTITNENFVFDLAKMPHLLMAGATGQGKSVGLNAILTSLLYKKHPSQLKFVLVDPKKVELTLYNKIERHYLAELPETDEPIITDTTKVINTLNSLCIEMDNRYDLLKKAMVRNIKEYNAKFISRRLNPEEGHKFLPYIVLVIDEFADLIMTAGKEVEMPIARLAQLARAIGIHLIVATQRPSVNVITGIIKANFPARAAFRVTSKIDSRTILDAGGADQLIGKGDMLFSQGSSLVRLQCAFLDTPEVELICDYIGNQQGYATAYQLPEYVGEEGGGAEAIDPKDRDAMFEDAARLVVIHQQGSTSLIQRKLKLGYNRAGRIVDQLEAAGILGPFEGSKARQVLVPDEMSLEQKLKGDA